MARFFKHGELPLVLLALIEEQPRHGYEIMAELTRLFGPRYRASPGSVYPALEALHAEGLVQGETVGDKTVHRITPGGARALGGRIDMLAALEQRVGVRVSPGDSLETLLNAFRARLVPLSGHVDPTAAEAILDRAAVDIEQLTTTRPRSQRIQHAG